MLLALFFHPPYNLQSECDVVTGMDVRTRSFRLYRTLTQSASLQYLLKPECFIGYITTCKLQNFYNFTLSSILFILHLSIMQNIACFYYSFSASPHFYCRFIQLLIKRMVSAEPTTYANVSLLLELPQTSNTNREIWFQMLPSDCNQHVRKERRENVPTNLVRENGFYSKIKMNYVNHV